MSGQTFTLTGRPKVVFRIVWRGSIKGVDCVRGVALNGKIPDPDAPDRGRVLSRRLI
jgi:hypothetical protein